MRQNSFLDTYCPENFKNHVTQENEIKASGNASKDDRTQSQVSSNFCCPYAKKRGFSIAHPFHTFQIQTALGTQSQLQQDASSM